MPRRRLSFERLLLLFTAASHLPIFVAWRYLAARLALPQVSLVAAAAALLAVLPIRGRVRLLQWDRHRQPWQRLFDEMYYVHWCATVAAAVPITVVCLGVLLRDGLRGVPPHLPGPAALACYVASLGVAFYAVVIRRRWVRLHKVDVAISGLPASFAGFRIVHLSDLHLGSHTPAATAQRWVARANAQAADLAVVTGDLVTSGTEFYGDVAEALGALRAPAGVFVSLGNHDYFGEGDALVTVLQNAGVVVLRNASTLLVRGEEQIRLAGVDDTWTRRADLGKTLADAPADTPTVLLAHDPLLFAQAATLGADLVLSGHTHGGQVAVPFLARRWNLSRLTHPQTYGTYTYGKSTLYVHGGLGVTGPPVRLGVPPEIVVLTLRAVT